MHNLGGFSSASDASLFGEVLSTNAIPHRIDLEEDGMYSVWIIDDSQFPIANDLLEKYLVLPQAETPGSNPAAPIHLRLAEIAWSFVTRNRSGK